MPLFIKRPVYTKGALTKNALSLLFAFNFSIEIIQLCLNEITGVGVAKFLKWAILLYFFVLALYTESDFIIHKDIIFMSAWIAFLLFSIFNLSLEVEEYITAVIYALIFGIFMYFMGRMLGRGNYENFINVIQICPVITSIAYIFLFRIAAGATASEVFYRDSTYSQSFGYSIVIPLSISIYMVLHKKFWHIPCVLILLYGILSSGARGPLMCAAGIAFIFAFYSMDIYSLKSLAFFLISAALCIWVILNYILILEFLAAAFEKYSISTRTILSLINGTFTNTDSRMPIYISSLDSIAQNLFIGTGAFRDRQYILAHAKIKQKIINGSLGTYPHNFFLEIFMQFGIILGSFLLLKLAKLMIQSYKVSKLREDTLFLYILLCSYGLMPLMWSRSYIQWNGFYLMLGFIFSQVWPKKVRHKKIPPS